MITTSSAVPPRLHFIAIATCFGEKVLHYLYSCPGARSCSDRYACSSRSNKALADSLDRAVDPRDPLVNRMLRIMATSAMSQAVYFSTGLQSQDQFYHYGTHSGRWFHPMGILCVLTTSPLHLFHLCTTWRPSPRQHPLPVCFRTGAGPLHSLHLAHPSLCRRGGAPAPHRRHRRGRGS